VPLANPVPAKINGEFLERIARNHWSVGVRPLPQDVFDKIMALAGVALAVTNDPITLPELQTVTIKESHAPLLARLSQEKACLSHIESFSCGLGDSTS
jgi:hypothetical protein